jgi:hypothetical protein
MINENQGDRVEPVNSRNSKDKSITHTELVNQQENQVLNDNNLLNIKDTVEGNQNNSNVVKEEAIKFEENNQENNLENQKAKDTLDIKEDVKEDVKEGEINQEDYSSKLPLKDQDNNQEEKNDVDA